MEEVASIHETGYICLYLHYGYRIKSAMVEDDTGRVTVSPRPDDTASTWINQYAGWLRLRVLLRRHRAIVRGAHDMRCLL